MDGRKIAAIPGSAIAYLVLIFAILLSYYRILDNGFVNLDDPLQVTANSHVLSGITWENIKWSFSFQSPCSPLTWLTYAATVGLFGASPGPFHAISLLLHTANSLLLLYALRVLTGDFRKSLAVSLLFAVHPINVESVAWIAEINNVLSGLFFMLTLVAYRSYSRAPGIWRYILVAVVFELGLLSKSSIMTLPFILLLLDFWPLKRIEIERTGRSLRLAGTPLKRLVLEKLPLLFLSSISLASSLLMQPQHTTFTPLSLAPMSLRISNALVSYLKYLGKLFWPVDLGVLYPYPSAIPLWETVGAVIVLSGVTFFAVRTFLQRPYLLVGWLWFLGSLVPFLGIIQSGLWPEMADRYAYIPFIGAFIILSWGTSDLLCLLGKKSILYAARLAAGAALCLLSLATWVQTEYWKDSVTLFEHVLTLNPDNEPAHGNLGSALLNRGEIEKALFHMKEALRLNPYSADTCFNLGMAYSLRNDHEKALHYLRRALQIDPGDTGSYNLAGNILAAAGRIDEAVEYYNKALRLNPRDHESYMNLGNTMLKSGNIDKAIQCYQEIIRIDPKCAEAYNNLGTAYINKGDIGNAYRNYALAVQLRPGYEDAVENMQKIDKLRDALRASIEDIQKSAAADPGNPAHYVQLAGLKLRMGETDGALKDYHRALSLKEDSLDALNGLLLIYSGRQEYANALDALRKIHELQPDNPDVYYNYACLYSRQNNIEEAVKWLGLAVEKGFSNWELIMKDPDLAGIRNTPFVMDLMKGRQEKPAEGF